MICAFCNGDIKDGSTYCKDDKDRPMHPICFMQCKNEKSNKNKNSL